MKNNIAGLLNQAEEKQERIRKASEMGLFPIGTEVVCICDQNCGCIGTIEDYDFEDHIYWLEKGSALFDYARKVTKLEKILK